MVYRDISSEYNSSEQSFKYPVTLMDRFFSFVIDYLIFSPFVSFVLFIFFKDAIRYWRLNPAAPEQLALTILLAVSYIALLSALQAGFITFWRSTPGQYFLKIQVHFENGENLIFWRSFCRQVGFWLTILFLGIPWLALMAHPMQKTFYDRIADCRVFSKKRSAQNFGFEIELRYWRSFLATLILFMGLILISVLVSQYRDVMNRTDSFNLKEKKNLFCEELKGISQTSRLQLAVAMNLVGQLSDECLDREADFVLWKEKSDQMGLAYYAKSLTEEQTDLERKYLKQACAESKDNLGCYLAQAFETADFEKLYRQMKVKKDILAKTLVYELGTVLGHNQERNEHFAELADFDSSKIVKKYILTEILMRRNKIGRWPASEEQEVDSEQEQALELIQDL